jgi:NAD(P)-dependent dehydrogenase (short-subunit alcohol dehydrogenase family)
MAQTVIDRFGTLDVLVNNADVIEVAPVTAMTVDDFATAHAVTFWGAPYPTSQLDSGIVRAATVVGRSAADRFHKY